MRYEVLRDRIVKIEDAMAAIQPGGEMAPNTVSAGATAPLPANPAQSPRMPAPGAHSVGWRFYKEE